MKKEVSVERIYRGQREFKHDLFKLKVAKMKRNEGWIHRAPNLIEFEHCHVYHSINEKTGKTNLYCSPLGGHFHEITVNWDKKSKSGHGPLVTVGPALTKKRIRIPGSNTPRNRVVPVSWVRYNANNDTDETVVDNHTHEAEYIDTERIVMGSRDQRREDERNRIRSAMDHSAPATQPMRQTQIQTSAGGAAPITSDAPPRVE